MINGQTVLIEILFGVGTLAFDEREKVPLHIKRTMGYDHVLNQIFPGIRQYYDSHVVVDYHMKNYVHMILMQIFLNQ